MKLVGDESSTNKLALIDSSGRVIQPPMHPFELQ
jgi:hypothetical protein